MNTNPLELEVKHTSSPEDEGRSFEEGGKPILQNTYKDERNQRVQIDSKQIFRDLVKHTKGWPKKVAGDLFAKNADGKMIRLSKSSEFFGWLNYYFEVDWNRPGIEKAEFFEFVKFNAESFDDWSDRPHFPPLKHVLYSHPEIVAGDEATLNEFLEFFTPSTALDRELILAFLATVFWGGNPSQRPFFVITSNDTSSNQGRGAGKTTLVNLISNLSGGQIQLGQSQDIQNVKRELLNRSDGNPCPRILNLDNLKSPSYSSADFEALITSEEITGHKHFSGGMSLKNYHVLVMTVNQPSFRKCLAQRAIVVELALPSHSPNWHHEVKKFVEVNRDKLFSDLKAFFDRPRGELPEQGTTRWGEWERDVLSRLSNPEQIRNLIISRQKKLDSDGVDSEDFLTNLDLSHRQGTLSHEYGAKYVNSKVLKIENPQMYNFFRDVTGETIGKNVLANKIQSFGIDCLKYERSSKKKGVWYFKPDLTKIQQEDLATQPAFVPPELEFEDSLCFDAAEGNPPQDTSADNT